LSGGGAQPSLSDGLIADEVKDPCEGWMNHVDQLLDDEAIVAAVYEALGRRHPKSRSRGRLGAPADVALRLLLLKHVRNWSNGFLSAKCAPIWSIATSPASAAARCLTPIRSTVGDWRSRRRQSWRT
jgi:transposase, IS5 family